MLQALTLHIEVLPWVPHSEDLLDLVQGSDCNAACLHTEKNLKEY